MIVSFRVTRGQGLQVFLALSKAFDAGEIVNEIISRCISSYS